MFLLVKVFYARFLQKSWVFPIAPTFTTPNDRKTATSQLSKSSQAEVQVPGFLHQRSLGFFQRGKALVSTNCKGRTSGEFTVGKKKGETYQENMMSFTKIVTSK